VEVPAVLFADSARGHGRLRHKPRWDDVTARESVRENRSLPA